MVTAILWIVSVLVAFGGGGVVGYWFCNRKVAEKVQAKVDEKISELKGKISEKVSE